MKELNCDCNVSSYRAILITQFVLFILVNCALLPTNFKLVYYDVNEVKGELHNIESWLNFLSKNKTKDFSLDDIIIRLNASISKIFDNKMRNNDKLEEKIFNLIFSKFYKKDNKTILVDTLI